MSVCEFKGSLKRAELDRLPGQQTGRGLVTKVANFQDGRLLLQPPDLRQQPGSFCLPAAGFPLMAWLSKFKALVRTCHTTVADRSTTIAAFKLTNPKVDKDSSEAANPRASSSGWTSHSLSPDSAGQRVFLSVYLNVFSPPKKDLPLIVDSVYGAWEFSAATCYASVFPAC